MDESPDEREINKCIAEFMGWSELEWRDAGSDGACIWPEGFVGKNPSGQPGYLTANFARSMDDLIPVIEKLRSRGVYLEIAVVGSVSYTADLYDGRDKWLAKGEAQGVTGMAMATCVAIMEYLEEDRKGDGDDPRRSHSDHTGRQRRVPGEHHRKGRPCML